MLEKLPVSLFRDAKLLLKFLALGDIGEIGASLNIPRTPFGQG